MTETTARRPGRALTLLALAAVALGVGLLCWGLLGQQTAPTAPTSTGVIDPTASPRKPPTASAVPRDDPDETANTDGADKSKPAVRPDDKAARARGNRGDAAASQAPLPLSPPRRLRIPALDIDTPINPIGKNPDGTLGVPQPGPRLDQAAWFEQSPSPGQPGPAIIEGHVDSEQGPSVFYKLADIRPGDEVIITREDSTTVTFTVDALRDVEKARFPTELVYGAKDLSTSRLRLITCSQFDPNIGTHIGNTVVFATRSDVERA